MKELLINGFENAIKEFKFILESNSQTYDDIIGLQTRYNRISKEFKNGLIKFEIADLAKTNIENAFIYIVNNLNENDLKK